jgi:hypothetical protein
VALWCSTNAEAGEALTQQRSRQSYCQIDGDNATPTNSTATVEPIGFDLQLLDEFTNVMADYDGSMRTMTLTEPDETMLFTPA